MEKRERYTVYADHDHMTFIMEDVFEGSELIATECVGWYFGEPTDAETEALAGRLTKVYE